MVQLGRRETITNYKKANKKLKAKIEVYVKQLEEKEKLIQEYERRLPKLKQLTKLSRITPSSTIKYRLHSDMGFGQGARSRKDGLKYINEILESLAMAYPNGQSIRELTGSILKGTSKTIRRWTIQRRCEDLKARGLVYRDKEKSGKYHLTELALGTQMQQGYWLERTAYDTLISRYTSPNSTIQEKLSALVVMLGIYVTYVMIQSVLDEDFHPFIGTKILGVQKIYDILKSRQKPEMGNVIKTRIEGAIHPVQIFLLFCLLVIPKRKLSRHGSAILDMPTTATTPYEFIPSGSFFEQNKTMFETLKKVFTDLYREDVLQLEGIRKEQVPNMAWYHLKATYRKRTKATNTGR